MPSDHSTMVHPLSIYFRHNVWANLLLFDACMQLDESQLSFSTAGTFGSIQGMLGHIVFAEERYIFHITGGAQAGDAQRPTPATPLSELRARAAASGETLHQLATTLDGNQRVQVGAGDDAFLISIEALLLQAIHHGSEHRTQIETTFGQLGIDPPGLSGWRYFKEQVGQ